MRSHGPDKLLNNCLQSDSMRWLAERTFQTEVVSKTFKNQDYVNLLEDIKNNPNYPVLTETILIKKNEEGSQKHSEKKNTSNISKEDSRVEKNMNSEKLWNYMVQRNFENQNNYLEKVQWSKFNNIFKDKEEQSKKGKTTKYKLNKDLKKLEQVLIKKSKVFSLYDIKKDKYQGEGLKERT